MTDVTQKLDALKKGDPRTKDLELTEQEIAELEAQDALAQNKNRNLDMRAHIESVRTQEFEEESGLKLEEEEVKDVKDSEDNKELSEDKKDDVEPKIKVKVDGTVEELTQAELDEKVKAYQKHKAADKRLEESSLIKKQIENERATLNQALEDFNKQKEEFEKTKNEMSKTEKREAEKALEISKDQIHDLVVAIREGGDEDASKAMFEFVETLRLPPQQSEVKTVSEEEIQSRINKGIEDALNNIAAENKKKEDEAYEKLRSSAEEKFKDTYSDQIDTLPDFYDHAVMYDKLLQKDTKWKDQPLVDRFTEAGRRATAFLTGKPITLEEEQKVNSEDKDKKKEKIVNLPTHSNKKAIIGDDEEQISLSSIVADMKRARHQI